MTDKAASIDAEMQRGKEFIAPHSLEAEMALLGALLVQPEYLAHCAMLDYGDFYAQVHVPIFRAISRLYYGEKRVDKISLAEHLRAAGELEACGGMAYLSSLMDTVQSASSAAYYAKIVHEKAVLRRLIDAGREIYALGYGGEVDVEGSLQSAQTALNKASDHHAAAQFDLPPTLAQRFAENQALPKLQMGARYGIASIDARTMGMQPEQITVIGARPGLGKSALGEHIALAAACNDPVLYIPAEMGASYTTDRIVARLAGTPVIDFQRGGRVGVPVDLAMYNLRVVPARTACDVGAIARYVDALQPKVVVFDHLRHMKGWFPSDGRTRADLASTAVLSELHALAMRSAIHLVLIQQLSRSATDETKRPKLSDLRDAGALEEIAHRVLLLHHPFSGEADTIVEVIAAKDRSAGACIYHVSWKANLAAFGDLDYDTRTNPPCCGQDYPVPPRRRRVA